jgi:hypothetical protein
MILNHIARYSTLFGIKKGVQILEQSYRENVYDDNSIFRKSLKKYIAAGNEKLALNRWRELVNAWEDEYGDPSLRKRSKQIEKKFQDDLQTMDYHINKLKRRYPAIADEAELFYLQARQITLESILK